MTATSALLAQVVHHAPFGGWGFGEFIIALIVIIGVLAIAWIAVRASGVPIPQWVFQIIGVVVLVVFAVVAIRIILSI